MMSLRSLMRSGAFGSALRVHKASSTGALVAVSSRKASSDIENWDKANKLFYGPERDTKNFPHPVIPEKPGAVRLGFIPEEWFTFFYPKTGVTGPYFFTAGLVLYLFSKEIYVIDHGFSEVIGFWGATIFIIKKGGPYVKKFLHKFGEKERAELFTIPLKKNTDVLNKTVRDAEKAIWQEDGQKLLYQAKRENVDLQLEAIYRQRLQTVYTQVKKRLDYQAEMQKTKRQFEQRHMVDWIVSNVIKNITPQQEKESITNCIANLNRLAQARAKA